MTKMTTCLCEMCHTGVSMIDVPKINSGYLEITFAPMFGGKTSYLLRQLGQWVDLNWPVLYVNHSLDDRSDDVVSTHATHSKLSTKIQAIKTSQLATLDVSNVKVIGVDEAQFYPDLVEVVTKWVDEMGKIVYIVGLDGDYKRNKFGNITDLIPLAEEVHKLAAVCSDCLKEFNGGTPVPLPKASFTHRIQNSNEQVMIGAGDIYEPLCRKHYLIKTQKA